MDGEDEMDQMCLEVADPQLRSGCHAVWGLGNQLFMFARKTEHSSSIPGTVPFIHHIKWNTEMHGPIPRKLLNEAHNIFLDLQKHKPETASGSDRKPQIVKFSRRYRSVIKACVLEFQRAVEECIDQNQRKKLEDQLQLYNMIELVWSLCEILFIERLPGGILLSQLLEWLRLHFTEADRKARAAISEEMAEDHELYWESVYTFVLHGRLDEARQLLMVHSMKDTSAFVSIDELLRKMPLFSRFTGQFLDEFEMKFRHWQDECRHRLEQGNFASNRHLQTVCRILCGEDSVFVEMKDLCETWYCMLVSRLLYQKPTANPMDLQYYAQFCIDVYGGNMAFQPWDHVMLAAMEFDLHQVIKESSSGSSDWWFVAHLTDLLHHSGQLESQRLTFGETLREFLLLEYASSLMSHESLWQVGASYLSYCPESGRAYLECYIEHIAIDTDMKARKVLKLCEQYELNDQVRSICKQMGMKAVNNGRLGTALSWGMRSKDVSFVTYLAERFLNEYTECGDFSNLDLVDNLGPSMLLSNKLTFLGKYREFHQLYEEGDQKTAAALLLSLLTSRLAPKQFWATLLADALPLLEVPEVIFNSQQTYELLHCLEEHTQARKLQDIPEKVQETEKEKLDLLRIALARNLARAIVCEGNTEL